MGLASSAKGDYAAALGSQARALAQSSVAVGSNAEASAETAVALGRSTTASGGASTALGASANASGYGSVALGLSAAASLGGATALGQEAVAANQQSTALGLASSAKGDYATALGSQAKATGASSVAVGSNVEASAEIAVALGRNVTVSKYGALALGSGTSATSENAVAIGSFSVANEVNTVSVGGSETVPTRKIVNVTDGSSSQDAATYGQIAKKGQTVTATVGSATDIQNNDNASLYKITYSAGSVASGNTGFLSGGTAYTEVRPTDGTYVKKASTTATNLAALDSALSKVDIKKDQSVTAVTTGTSGNNNIYAADGTTKLATISVGSVASGNTGFVSGGTVYTYGNPTSGSYVKSGSTVGTNLAALDTAIGAKQAGNYYATTDSVEAQLQKLDTAVGAKTSGTYYLSTDTVEAQMKKLDTAIGNTSIKSVSGAVSTAAGTTQKATLTLGDNSTKTIEVAGQGAVASGDVRLVNGNTVYTYGNPTSGSYVKSGSSVGVNLTALDEGIQSVTADKTSDYKFDKTTKKVTVSNAAGDALFTLDGSELGGGSDYTAGTNVSIDSNNKISVTTTGTIASANTGILTGGTAYTELRPTNGSVVKQASTTAANLAALDAALTVVGPTVVSGRYEDTITSPDGQKMYGNYIQSTLNADGSLNAKGTISANLNALNGKMIAPDQTVNKNSLTIYSNDGTALVTFTQYGEASGIGGGGDEEEASLLQANTASLVASNKASLSSLVGNDSISLTADTRTYPAQSDLYITADKSDDAKYKSRSLMVIAGDNVRKQAYGAASTSFGYAAIGHADGSTAIGSSAYADAEGAVALGSESAAYEADTVSFGHKAGDLDPYSLKNSTTASGYESDYTRRLINVSEGIDGTDAATVSQIAEKGGSTKVTSTGKAEIKNADGETIYTITGIGSGTGGGFSIVDYNEDYETDGNHWLSTDYGETVKTKGKDSTAYGYQANAQADNSVAIGSGSVATEANTFAVGSTTSQRKIVNVAKGAANTDAATYAQIAKEGQTVELGKANGNTKIVSNDDTTLATVSVTEGAVASGDKGLLTGGVAYTELRPTNGSYVKQASTTAANLAALDTAIGAKTSGNYYATTDSVEAQIQKVDAAIGAKTSGNYYATSDSVGVQIQKVDAAIGAKTSGTYYQTTDTVEAQMKKLDTAITQSYVDGKAYTIDADNKKISVMNKDGTKAFDLTVESSAFGSYSGSDTITISDEGQISAKTGAVASGEKGLLTGGAAYTELRPTNGNYVQQANTTAANLAALDTAIGAKQAGNYYTTADSVEAQLNKVDAKIGAAKGADGVYEATDSVEDQIYKSIEKRVAAGQTVSLETTSGTDATNVIKAADGTVLATLAAGSVASGNNGFVSGGDVYSEVRPANGTLVKQASTTAANLTALDKGIQDITVNNKNDYVFDKTSKKVTVSNADGKALFTLDGSNLGGGSSIVDSDETDHWLSTDFGEDVGTKGVNSTAFGYQANAAEEGSVALGYNAKANAVNSVALGTGSVADEENVVSVGGGDVATRRIVNVANGESNSDAATYGQTFKAGTVELTSSKNTITSHDGSTMVTFKQASISNNNTGFVSGGQLYTEGRVTKSDSNYNVIKKANTIAANLEALDSAIENGGVITGDEADDQRWLDVKWNDGDDVTRGANSAAYGYQANAAGEAAVALGYNAKANGMNSVALGSGSVADEDNVVSVGGGDVATRKIVNVANGTANSDAATYGQTFKTATVELSSSKNKFTSNDGATSVTFKQATISSNNTGFVSGGQLYTEGRVSGSNYNVISKGNTIAKNLEALDAALNSGTTALIVGDEDAHVLDVSWNEQIGDENGRGTNSAAYGYQANALGNDSLALGYNARANGEGSVALGSGSVADDDNVVSVGSTSAQRKIVNVAKGTAATDAATVAQIAKVGGSSTVDANGTVTIKNVSGDTVYTIKGVGSGSGSSVVESDEDAHWLSTDMGETISKKGTESTAYGYKANAQADNSVAIGAGSVATEENTFSVGSTTSQRKIVNVADGLTATDAATFGQINVVAPTVVSGRYEDTITSPDGKSMLGTYIQSTLNADGSLNTNGTIGANLNALNAKMIAPDQTVNKNSLTIYSNDGTALVTFTQYGEASGIGGGGDEEEASLLQANTASLVASNKASLSSLVANNSTSLTADTRTYPEQTDLYITANSPDDAKYKSRSLMVIAGDNVRKQAYGAASTSFGYAAIGHAAGSTAIGSSAYADAEGAVALGSESAAYEADTVSFGHKAGDLDPYSLKNSTTASGYESDYTRRLVNVSEGIDGTDVATVSQIAGKGKAFTVDEDGKVSITNADGTELYTIEGIGTGSGTGVTYTAGDGISIANRTISADIGTVDDVVKDNKQLVSGDTLYQKTAENKSFTVDQDGKVSITNADGTELYSIDGIGTGSSDVTYTAGDGIVISNRTISADIGTVADVAKDNKQLVTGDTLYQKTAENTTFVASGGKVEVKNADNEVLYTISGLNNGSGSGTGTAYSAGDGILIDDENNIISADVAAATDVKKGSTKLVTGDVLYGKLGEVTADGTAIKKANTISQNLKALDDALKQAGAGGNETGEGTTATGSDNTVSGEGSSTTGSNNNVHGSTTEDPDTGTTTNGSTATGTSNVVGTESTPVSGSTATGNENEIYSDKATAIGNKNIINADATGSTAVGNGNGIDGAGSIAVGNDNAVVGAGSGAVGTGNKVTGDGTYVLGSGITTGSDNSVLLGAGSTAKSAGMIGERDNIVSVGSAGNERQIINVAAGTKTTDAANFGQLVKIQDYTASNGEVTLETNAGTKFKISGLGTGSGTGVAYKAGDNIDITDNKISAVTGDIASGETGLVTGEAVYSKLGEVSSTGSYKAISATNTVSENLAALDKALSEAGISGGNTTGEGSTATGSGNTTSGQGSTATGKDNKVDGEGSTATGDKNTVNGDGSTATGSGNTVNGGTSSGSGSTGGSTATGNNNTIGTESKGVSGSTATGNENEIYSDGSTAVGDKNVIKESAEGSTAIGNGNEVSGAGSLADGIDNTVSGAGSVAGGIGNDVSGAGSGAYGSNNKVTGADTYVLGSDVTTGAKNSVVLGAGSTTDRDDVVSVGSVGGERQIINVAAGTKNTDAANFGQLVKIQNYTASNGTVTLQTNDGTEFQISGLGTGSGSGTGVAYTAGQNIAISDQNVISAVVGDISKEGSTGLASASDVYNTVTNINSQLDKLANAIDNIEAGGSGTTGGGSNNVDGTGSSAVGKENTVTGEGSTATGDKNTVTGNGSTATGSGNSVSGGTDSQNGSSATGNNNTIGTDTKGVSGSTATGNGNEIYSDGSTATGDKNVINQGATGSNATGTGNVIGSDSTSEGTGTGKNSSATGNNNSIYSDESVAIGDKNVINQGADGSTATGTNNTISGAGSVANGMNNTISGAGSGATGAGNTVSGADSVATGMNNTVSGAGSGATGTNNTVYGGGSYANGSNVTIGSKGDASVGKDTFVLGSDVTTTANNSVILGKGSTTDRDNVVSVGGGTDSTNRQIINVAAGTKDTDAVNLGQIKQLISNATDGSSVNNEVKNETSNATGMDNVIDSSASGSTATGTKNEITGKDSTATGKGNTVSGEGSSATGTDNTISGKGSAADGMNNTVSGAGSAASGIENTVSGAGSIATGAGNTVSGASSGATGSSNKVYGGNSYSVGTNNTIGKEGDSTVGQKTYALGDNISTTANNAVVLGSGSTATRDNVVSVGSEGAERQIINVAPGVAGTDAVNVNQLNSMRSEMSQEAKDAGAVGAALAGLHPLDYDPENKVDFAVASGTYRGQTAFALGAFFRPTKDVMFSVGSTLGNTDTAWNVGASFKIGRRSAMSGLGTSELSGQVNRLAQYNTQIVERMNALNTENQRLKDAVNMILQRMEMYENVQKSMTQK